MPERPARGERRPGGRASVGAGGGRALRARARLVRRVGRARSREQHAPHGTRARHRHRHRSGGAVVGQRRVGGVGHHAGCATRFLGCRSEGRRPGPRFVRARGRDRRQAILVGPRRELQRRLGRRREREGVQSLRVCELVTPTGERVRQRLADHAVGPGRDAGLAGVDTAEARVGRAGAVCLRGRGVCRARRDGASPTASGRRRRPERHVTTRIRGRPTIRACARVRRDRRGCRSGAGLTLVDRGDRRRGHGSGDACGQRADPAHGRCTARGGAQPRPRPARAGLAHDHAAGSRCAARPRLGSPRAPARYPARRGATSVRTRCRVPSGSSSRSARRSRRAAA